MNTDTLVNKFWSEPCFYYFLLYLQRLLFQVLKSGSFKSFSLQSTAQSFSWFFLITKTSHRAATGTGHSTWENTALSESPLLVHCCSSSLCLTTPAACCLAKGMRAARFFLPQSYQSFLYVLSWKNKIASKVSWTQKITSKPISIIQLEASTFHLTIHLSQEPLNSLISLKRCLNSPHAFRISSDWCPLLWVRAKENCMFIREAHISHFPCLWNLRIHYPYITHAHHAANQISKSTNSKRAIAPMCK